MSAAQRNPEAFSSSPLCIHLYVEFRMDFPISIPRRMVLSVLRVPSDLPRDRRPEQRRVLKSSSLLRYAYADQLSVFKIRFSFVTIWRHLIDLSWKSVPGIYGRLLPGTIAFGVVDLPLITPQMVFTSQLDTLELRQEPLVPFRGTLQLGLLCLPPPPPLQSYTIQRLVCKLFLPPKI